MKMTCTRATIVLAAGAAIAIALALMSPPGPRRWIIEGRAATSDLDLNDVMFEESALRRAAETMMDYPTVLLNHKQDRPIGRILSAKFVVDMLWITAEISRTEPEVWAKIEDGTLSGLSIGIVPLAEEVDWSDDRSRAFTSVTRFVIVDVSVVAVPSNPHTRIVSAEERCR